MSSYFDLAAAIVLAIAVVHGWRRGGTRAVVRLAGLALGAVIGFAVAGAVVSAALSPVAQLALDVVLVLGIALLGRSAASALADRLVPRRGVVGHVVRTGDRIVGVALYGMVAAAVCSITLTGIAVLAPPGWASAARDSAAARLLRPAGSAIDSATGHILAGAPADVRALVPSIGPKPSTEVAAGVAAADARSVVEVEADGCAGSVEGTGFAVGTGHLVVTNAHVVRGAGSVGIVSADGAEFTARVIAFDPTPDLAVLDVNNVALPPLTVAGDASNGSPAVVVGYPDGVRTVTPASVITRMPVTGPDWNGVSLHEAYVLDAPVRHGNSGSPLLDLQGRVRGVVNALSKADPDEGFAITATELRRVLARTTSTSPVPTGTCAT